MPDYIITTNHGFYCPQHGDDIEGAGSITTEEEGKEVAEAYGCNVTCQDCGKILVALPQKAD